MATIQMTKVATAPSTEGIGICAPRTRTLNGTLNGLRRWLGPPQLDYGELCGGEREQDAEAVQAREKGDGLVQRGDGEDDRCGDHDRCEHRLRRDERPPVRASEDPWQLLVLAERVRETPEAGDRRRGRE